MTKISRFARNDKERKLLIPSHASLATSHQSLVPSHFLRFHTDDTEAGEAQDGEAPAGEVDVVAHLRNTLQIGKDEAGDGRAFIFSCKIDLQPV